jgi:hypothetical protein
MRPFLSALAERASVTIARRNILPIPTDERTLIDVAYSLKLMARPLLLFFRSHLFYGWPQ